MRPLEQQVLFSSITTHKCLKGEVSKFETVEIEVLHSKCIKINLDPTLPNGLGVDDWFYIKETLEPY